jgi:YVTN family beta-propeller protein
MASASTSVRHGLAFRVLGPLEVSYGETPVPIAGSRQRALLAYLVLNANRVVPSERLIDELFGEGPPESALNSVHAGISRLRRQLTEAGVPEVPIVTRPPGYLFELAAGQLDLQVFERLLERGRRQLDAGAPGTAAETLREALDLWRGPPLADIARYPFARTEISRLEDLRLAAITERIEADLACGRHAEVVGELEALVAEYPLQERLRGLLMLALYRSGRQADALQTYQDTRRLLVAELGLEPSAELRGLERRILAHDVSLDPTPAVDEPVAADVPGVTSQRSSRRRRAMYVTAAAVLLLAAVISVVVVAPTDNSPAEVVASSGSVALIDPQANRVAAAIHVGERPTRIAVRGDAIWVLHPDIRTLSLLSRTERKVVRRVGLGGAPSALAVDEHGVWVSDARAASVTLIEPERLTVARTVRTRPRPLPGPYTDAGQLAIGFGSLWFASGESTITRIDAATGRVMTRIRHVDTGEALGGIAIGEGSVWVAGPFQESMVTRIDPSRNRIVATIPIQKFRLNGIASGGGGVWVSDVGSDQVWLIDPISNATAGATKVGGQPLSVAYGFGSIWVANSGDGTVSRIDATSGRIVGTITVGGSPNGIAVTDDGIWVTVD